MNIIKRLTAIVFALVTVLALSSCGRTEPASYKVKRAEQPITVSAQLKDKSLLVSKPLDKLKLIARSDMTELYFDEHTCTVSVFDIASGRLWSSLPEKAGEQEPSAVALGVLINGNSYTLYSQSDSVGFSSALYEISEKGVTVNYTFMRTLEDGTGINLFLPVSYKLADGALTVEVDCGALEGENHDENVEVTQIELLPFFGSDTKGAKGDYILVPDGCGATIDISEKPEEFESLSFPVYEQGNLIGAFGMKRESSAFAVLIDEGEELASIKVHKALSGGGHNRVGACFNLKGVKSDGDEVLVAERGYEGKIRMTYRFLSYDNATYTGMAGAVRELLIRKGMLLSKRDDRKEGYPFNLSLVFRSHLPDSKGKILSRTLTTYSQAQEILDSLKAKGIGNINLRMKGALTPENIKDAKFSSEVGRSAELEALLSYGGDEVSFFVDGSIVSDFEKENAAIGIDGEPLLREGKALLGTDLAKENTQALLGIIRDKGLQGACINDAASFLYEDYTLDKVSLKPETANVISSQIASVSASGKLMTETGNIYAVKYADMVVKLPITAKIQQKELCARVPFVQAVLHGLVDYSCEPVNSFENSEKAFLKCIEYGAIPYYEWHAADLSTDEAADKSNYLNSMAEAQLQYERASSLEDLLDARITDHYRVKKNVYYTCYDNSTGIYVNYNSEPAEVNGVTVEPMSFIRVN